MFAILLEHYAGKWPFWLSPRQCIACPVSEKFTQYAIEVRDAINAAGYFCDADVSDRKLQKKDSGGSVGTVQLHSCGGRGRNKQETREHSYALSTFMCSMSFGERPILKISLNLPQSAENKTVTQTHLPNQLKTKRLNMFTTNRMFSCKRMFQFVWLYESFNARELKDGFVCG